MLPDGEAWRWLERTELASAMREGVWLYPAVETVHILGLAALFGAILIVDLRILGVSRLLPLDALARHALRPVYVAFPALVATGSLMFASDASALVVNPAFRAKMVLVPLAVLNALAFELGWFRRLRAAPATPVPALAKVFAGASLGLWSGVIVCGRLIAYM